MNKRHKLQWKLETKTKPSQCYLQKKNFSSEFECVGADLYECPHLPALLPVPGGVVEDDVRGPDPLPGQPRHRQQS